jgi:hypothetical protein
MRQARETIEVLRRLRASGNSREDIVSLHELHARHERELGHEENAARADARARYAKDPSQCDRA